MKFAATLLLAAASFALAQPLDAQPMQAPPAHGGMAGHMEEMGGHMGGMHGDGSAFTMLLKSANLTEPQRGQLREIMQAEHAQMEAVHRQFHAVHQQLAEKLLSPGNVTAADLRPLEQKAFHYQQQIDQSMIDTALAIRNILTPEQLNRLAQVHRQLETLHAQIQNLVGADQPDEAAPE